MKSSLKILVMIVLLAAPFASQGLAQTSIYSGQFAVGGGYTTIVTLLNTGGASANGTITFTDQQGSPFTVRVTMAGSQSVTVSSLALASFPAGGSTFITIGAVNAADPTKSGWIRIEYMGGSVNGVATFLLTEGSTLKTIAGVLSSQPLPFATIPVDNSEADGRFTGFAIANHNSSSMSVRLVTLDENGTIVDNVLPGQLNLAARAQTAVFLHQILTNRVNFRGSMALVGQGGQNFVVVALVLNQGLLTAIPVIREKAPVVP